MSTLINALVAVIITPAGAVMSAVFVIIILTLVFA
jgi:hypothetical protein